MDPAFRGLASDLSAWAPPVCRGTSTCRYLLGSPWACVVSPLLASPEPLHALVLFSLWCVCPVGVTWGWSLRQKHPCGFASTRVPAASWVHPTLHPTPRACCPTSPTGVNRIPQRPQDPGRGPQVPTPEVVFLSQGACTSQMGKIPEARLMDVSPPAQLSCSPE